MGGRYAVCIFVWMKREMVVGNIGGGDGVKYGLTGLI
jgi:hypothetical protein